jgi:hypothetical protein
MRHNKPLLSGTILAAFTAIKYFPLVVVGGYFLAGIWKPRNVQLLSFFTVSLILLFIGQLAFFGPGLMDEFINSSFLPHLDGELSGQGLYSFQFQSWDNLFRNLFVFHATENTNPFIDWIAGRQVAKFLVYLIVILSMFAVLIKNRQMTENKEIIFLSLPALAALVILPATATYHFILLIFPLSILISSSLLKANMKTLILIIYGLIGFIPYGFCFRLGETYGVLFAYPRLFLVTLLYILVCGSLVKQHRNA